MSLQRNVLVPAVVSLVAPLLAVPVALALPAGAAPPGTAPPGGAPSGAALPVRAADPGFLLTSTQPGGPGFAPAFVGNGYLAGRQPADGQGYGQVRLPGRTTPLPTQSQVHGFFARLDAVVDGKRTGLIERRAALPTWSTLAYSDGSGTYSLATGTVRGYRQTLDLRSGTLTTRLTWTSPAGRPVDLAYDVTPDRARRRAAVVRLTLVPRTTGPVTVSDILDGRGAELTVPRGVVHAGRTQAVRLATVGLGVTGTVASTLTPPAGTAVTPVARADRQTAAQAVRWRAVAGRRYTVTKSVGVATSSDTRDPYTAAVAASRAEARLGYAGMRVASDAAWARLWRVDIQVRGDPRLQRQVRAAFYSLLASVRADTPWAPSPGGLSSDGYNGHVFWDSETWMYPTLLATEPDVARATLRYRLDRLAAARRYAAETGSAGARFPWESALTGGEDTPVFARTGELEVHVSADVSLAFHQYWLATGDRGWLARDGWPVLSEVADYWVSRSVRNADGSASIRNVIPPDEYAEGVDDSVYTNVAARDALRFAGQAAALLGRRPDPRWAEVAGRLRVLFDQRLGVHPEYAGYPGDAVKQADVTLLSYPWENPQPRTVTQADLDYYVPRTDPGGPSMTDAIHSIVTSELGTPGCAAFSFTRRSVDPFVRAPYDQFSEARNGGAFTFTTGAGGFLQEFLYGYSGFRWRADRVRLDPSLPPQLAGVTLSALSWRGRVLRVQIGPRTTSVRLLSGAPAVVESPAGVRVLTAGSPVVLPTRRPDLTPTADTARCRPAVAAPATAEPAESAVDGTVSTAWLGDAPAATLRVDLGRTVPVGRVEVRRPAVSTVPGTEQGVTRPTVSAGEAVDVSTDGVTWRRLGVVTRPALRDVVSGGSRPARYVRLTALGGTADRPLVVGELDVRAGTGWPPPGPPT